MFHIDGNTGDTIAAVLGVKKEIPAGEDTINFKVLIALTALVALAGALLWTQPTTSLGYR